MKYVLGLLVIVLSLVYIVITPKISLLRQSEIDLIKQEKRMKAYDPPFYRLANILEKRPENRVFIKLKNNFFSVFNVDSRYIFLVPFVVIGFFRLIKFKKYGFILALTALPFLAITFVGRNENFGFFCLYPFLLVCFIYGLEAIFNKK